MKKLMTLMAATALTLSSSLAMAEMCHVCDFSDEPIVVTPTPKSGDDPAAKPGAKRQHEPLLKLKPQLQFRLGGRDDERRSGASVKLGFKPQFGF